MRNTQEALEKQAQMSLVEVLTDSTDMNHSWVRNVSRVEPLYVCIYIYKERDIYTKTHSYIYIYIHIYICVYIYIHIYIHIYICIDRIYYMCTYIFL